MTGQVKEDILSRFGELGIRVRDGALVIDPALLRPAEFLAEPGTYQYLDLKGDWRELTLPARALAFTWCQVPIVYRITDDAAASLTVIDQQGMARDWPSLELPADICETIFKRKGEIRQINAELPSSLLLSS